MKRRLHATLAQGPRELRVLNMTLALALALAGAAAAQEAAPPAALAVTLAVGDGIEITVDPATGRLRPLPSAARVALADALTSRPAAARPRPAEVERRPDGTLVLSLDDRFLAVTVARLLADGSVVTTCVDPAAAEVFARGELDIDPFVEE